MQIADIELTDHSFALCQRLLRVDTTNPPGAERAAADLLAEELTVAGLEPTVLESAPGRANVVTRLKGTGELPPLLLTAHLDVVEADPSQWRQPPFSGVVADDCLWGRGAIDMKNHAAMAVAILCRLAREGHTPRRDLIFAGVADEESGCRYGSLWLCEEHPDLVRAEYAIGEGGGFNFFVAGREYVSVQAAEKGVCWVRATVRGEPGHGSMPREDSAVVRLSEAVARLGRKGLPAHASAPVRRFVRALVPGSSEPLRIALNALLHPSIAPHILRAMPDPSAARALKALMGNTASPTVLRAGSKTNVIPGVAEAEIDGRVLPGQTTDSFLAELSGVLGEEVELEVLHSLPPVETEPFEGPLLDAITGALNEHAPGKTMVPGVLPGFTDAKAFTRLGTRWYGFAPVRLPRDMRFADLFHGNDERIPVDGLAWGTETLADVVTGFCF